MPFSDSTRRLIYNRAGGRCECTRDHFNHLGRCNKVLVWDEWEAHHRTSQEADGGDFLSNGEALCKLCHDTVTYGRQSAIAAMLRRALFNPTPAPAPAPKPDGLLEARQSAIAEMLRRALSNPVPPQPPPISFASLFQGPARAHKLDDDLLAALAQKRFFSKP